MEGSLNFNLANVSNSFSSTLDVSNAASSSSEDCTDSSYYSY
jgi:hypothetical protein